MAKINFVVGYCCVLLCTNVVTKTYYIAKERKKQIPNSVGFTKKKKVKIKLTKYFKLSYKATFLYYKTIAGIRQIHGMATLSNYISYYARLENRLSLGNTILEFQIPEYYF